MLSAVYLLLSVIHVFGLARCSLETSGRLMELNTKDGRLHVSYSDRLVTLIREVRMLLQRGFAVPAKIQHVAQVADKFKLHANILKQVRLSSITWFIASFDNFHFRFAIFILLVSLASALRPNLYGLILIIVGLCLDLMKHWLCVFSCTFASWF